MTSGLHVLRYLVSTPPDAHAEVARHASPTAHLYPLPPHTSVRLAGDAVASSGQDLQPFRIDRARTVGAQAVSPVIESGQGSLRLRELLPGRGKELVGHQQLARVKLVVVVVADLRQGVAGEFNDVGELLTPLLLEQQTSIRQVIARSRSSRWDSQSGHVGSPSESE